MNKIESITYIDTHKPTIGERKMIFGRKNNKSQAQLDYEADVAKNPYYPDGGKRKTWDELDEPAQWSWRHKHERK